MLFERQRLLLTMLDAIGEPVRNTDFQKLLFLYTRTEQTPSYEFVPYKYGAFSFTSYADKRRLAEAGLLTNDDQQWELTEKGRAMARKQAVLPLVVGKFCRAHRHLRGNNLIAEQYRKHPYYATRSEIVEKVLPDAAERRAVDKARPPKPLPGLVTLGYEGRSLEAYLNVLLKNSVTLLCDVRRNPLSRKYGFSKSTLSKACEGVGIRYEHLPELGIASEERQELVTQADYEALFAEYERKSLRRPEAVGALAKIRAWIEQGERVALTCYEAQPGQCHRHCVAEALERDSKAKLRAQHL